MALNERRALTLLCQDLDELRAELARPDHPRDLFTTLDDLVTSAQAGRPIAKRLSKLIGPLASEYRSIGPLPGLGPGHADRELFGCPDGRCDLVRTTEPAGPLPRCRILGRAMPRREPS
ncbi:MAG: hypothetical protein QOG10_1043 [Kribbellaceae bacterium]|jgi:hypothetical protein|nr:hypothetical protein [Kribbellaceae bacterium]